MCVKCIYMTGSALTANYTPIIILKNPFTDISVGFEIISNKNEYTSYSSVTVSLISPF